MTEDSAIAEESLVVVQDLVAVMEEQNVEAVEDQSVGAAEAVEEGFGGLQHLEVEESVEAAKESVETVEVVEKSLEGW